MPKLYARYSDQLVWFNSWTFTCLLRLHSWRFQYVARNDFNLLHATIQLCNSLCSTSSPGTFLPLCASAWCFLCFNCMLFVSSVTFITSGLLLDLDYFIFPLPFILDVKFAERKDDNSLFLYFLEYSIFLLEKIRPTNNNKHAWLCLIELADCVRKGGQGGRRTDGSLKNHEKDA